MGAAAKETEQPPQATAETVDSLLEAARYDDIDDIKSILSSGVSLDLKDSEGRTVCVLAFLCISLILFAPALLLLYIWLQQMGILTLLTILSAVERMLMLVTQSKTPLHWASLNGHVEVVKCLILAGANISLLNSHEKTAIDEAISTGKMDVLNACNQ